MPGDVDEVNGVRQEAEKTGSGEQLSVYMPPQSHKTLGLFVALWCCVVMAVMSP